MAAVEDDNGGAGAGGEGVQQPMQFAKSDD